MALKHFLYISMCVCGFGQLLSLDLENVISEGMKSLSEKERLIDEALSESFEITLGVRFGRCLVFSICPNSFIYFFCQQNLRRIKI